MNDTEKSKEQLIQEIQELRQKLSKYQQLETALSRKEAENRALLEAIPDLIIRFKNDGTYLDFIEANNINLLIPTKDRIGKTIFEILPAYLAEKYNQNIQLASYTQETQHFQYELEIKDILRDYEARVVAINETEVLMTVRDITEQKQIEEALIQEKQKSEKLLLNILPEVIAHQLKENQQLIADDFAQVTVLFADLVGFTEISSRISPKELVIFLNQVFSEFDYLCEKYSLEKIKTIGDAYMVVGGLPLPREDHVSAIADMALEMLSIMQKLTTPNGKKMNLRIGINTGSVVAGVIGKKKFIYDLWGDAVNIASRMESLGNPGKIQVSESVYQNLKNDYVFESRGLILVKGKGEMYTYWLKSK